MQVGGPVSGHVMNIMGVAVMCEQYHNIKSELLDPATWSRHVVKQEIAELFQDSSLNVVKISDRFTDALVGYKLDAMDMIFLPLKKCGFWYLIVANFRNKRFEVISANDQVEALKDDAAIVVSNFRRVFKLAYPWSIRVDFYSMGVIYCNISKSITDNDSGVFIMQLIQKYDGNTKIYFHPEYANVIRQILSCYIAAHKYNNKLLPDIQKILQSNDVSR
ncbi:hypothetical protein ACP70R_046520 [Stipagrostis hirtigluma subsp. patula]